MNIKIFSTKSKVELMGVKNLLDFEGINYFDINKSDSSYAGLFGQYELSVQKEDEEKAKMIIERFLND